MTPQQHCRRLAIVFYVWSLAIMGTGAYLLLIEGKWAACLGFFLLGLEVAAVGELCRLAGEQ